MSNLPYEADRAVEDRAGHLVEILSRELDGFESFEECSAYLRGMKHDDTLNVGLNLDESLEVLEFLAEDHGYRLKNVNLGNLREKVEHLACILIHHEACARIEEFFPRLESLMDAEDLDFSHAAPGHVYDSVAHQSERDLGDVCTVYEYRDGGGMDADLYLFRIFGRELPFVINFPADLKGVSNHG